MPKLEKCADCGRKGGYARTAKSKKCARCEMKGDSSEGNGGNGADKNKEEKK